MVADPGGITKNWTGWGNTILYGEYGRFTDWGAEQGGRNFTPGSPQTFGFAAIQNVKTTDANVWGLASCRTSTMRRLSGTRLPQLCSTSTATPFASGTPMRRRRSCGWCWDVFDQRLQPGRHRFTRQVLTGISESENSLG